MEGVSWEEREKLDSSIRELTGSFVSPEAGTIEATTGANNNVRSKIDGKKVTIFIIIPYGK